MTKLKMHDTPSESIIKAAQQPSDTTDSKGRVIGIKKMGALDRLKMFEVIGADNAKNEPYLGYAALAFHVCSIDGDPVMRPANKIQLEGLINRLGDEGLEAVGQSLQESMSEQ